MPDSDSLTPIGMNARLFPSNWRPARAEIAFAAAAGFRAVQFPGPETGLDATRLGDPLDTVAGALRAAGVMPVMEMLIRVDTAGRTAQGATPLDVLRANLPAIRALRCACVHAHLVPSAPAPTAALKRLEDALLPQWRAAVALAAAVGFRFGLEHNEPGVSLIATPERCAALLAAVPGLGLVWDLNHTVPAHLAGFLALTPRMQMLHVSDTPLPAVNAHLPLGLGTIDFTAYARALRAGGFRGPAILEIGGLPQSGGYGRDTDAALIDSRARFQAALAAADSTLPGA